MGWVYLYSTLYLLLLSLSRELRVYARGDTGYTFGAIAILVRLPSDGPQVYLYCTVQV
jgi:hypothetical protein